MLMRDLPKRIAGAQQESMRSSLSELNRALRTDAQRSRFTGGFADSISSRTEGQPTSEQFIGRVLVNKANAENTEYGRGQGGMPPIDRMKEWAAQKLGDESLGYVIARSIAQKGTLKGKRKGYVRGWAHVRYTAKRRAFRVRRTFRDNIRRAVRLAGG